MPIKLENRIKKFQQCYEKDEVTGCWNWQKAKNVHGYGASHFKNRPMGAHRVAYMLFVADIPNNLFVCHKCDNRICVNPEHLFLGTNYDNVQDMIKKGRLNKARVRRRYKRGENQHFSKLTETQVLEIRNTFIPGKTTYKAMGKKYNVDQGNIFHIIKNKSWKHLLPEEQAFAKYGEN